MWSSEDGASKVLADITESDTDDRGYPPGTSGWGDRDDASQVVVFCVWGDRAGEVLAALESTASWAEDHYSDAGADTDGSPGFTAGVGSDQESNVLQSQSSAS